MSTGLSFPIPSIHKMMIASFGWMDTRYTTFSAYGHGPYQNRNKTVMSFSDLLSAQSTPTSGGNGSFKTVFFRNLSPKQLFSEEPLPAEFYTRIEGSTVWTKVTSFDTSQVQGTPISSNEVYLPTDQTKIDSTYSPSSIYEDLELRFCKDVWLWNDDASIKRLPASDIPVRIPQKLPYKLREWRVDLLTTSPVYHQDINKNRTLSETQGPFRSQIAEIPESEAGHALIPTEGILYTRLDDKVTFEKIPFNVSGSPSVTVSQSAISPNVVAFEFSNSMPSVLENFNPTIVHTNLVTNEQVLDAKVRDLVGDFTEVLTAAGQESPTQEQQDLLLRFWALGWGQNVAFYDLNTNSQDVRVFLGGA